MQKSFLLALALLSPALVMAQQVKKVTTQEVVEALPENLAAPQQVYVVQNPATVQTVPQVIVQPQVRTQPVTVIEDTPLRESKADALRKNRVEVEQETESKIVEKLEEERMKAERERAQKIMESLEAKKVEPTPAPVATPAPQVHSDPFQYPPATQPVQMAPVQQVSEPVSVISTDVVRDEIKSEDKVQSKFYVSGLVGLPSYDVANMSSKIAAGFSLGMQLDNGFAVELNYLFSKYDLEDLSYSGSGGYYGYPYGYPSILSLEQQNIMGAIKYSIIDSRVTPVVGALVGYTRRNYSQSQYNAYQQVQEVNSNAFDFGGLVGLDVKLTDKLIVGGEFRYLTNLSYDVENSYKPSFTYKNALKSPEQLDYYVIGVGAKLQF